MQDYLKEICVNSGINIVYTSNKVTVLSSSISNNIPTLRVHNLFEGCKREAAEAIVHYYTDMQNKEGYLKVIKSYIDENFKLVKYKIMPADKEFEKYFIKTEASKTEVDKNSYENQEDSSMVELEIIQIKAKDFWGDDIELDAGNCINVSGSEMIEIDIEVDKNLSK